MRKISLAVAVTTLLLAGRAAWAEPYLAAWKGVNCNACHVNQTGGWLRNDFGKNYGNSLQTFDWQGISDAAQKISHNTPSWVSVGMDIHESYVATLPSNPALNQSAFNDYFPLSPSRMGFSICAKANNVISGVFTYRLDEGTPKEVYALISNLPEGAYLKLGRFLLPYGLGLSDDNSLVRLPLVNSGPFSFDNLQFDGVEAGIYPGNFFVNAAVVNGDNAALTNPSFTFGAPVTMILSEKIVSARGGFNFNQVTIAGSFYGENMDLGSRKLRYGAYGWTRLGPAVVLAEYDSGYDGVGSALPGPITTQTNYQAYHVSAEFDLGSSVYLRLTNEWLNDSLAMNPSDGYREVVSLRCYPVQNLKAQIDVARMDPLIAVNNPNYAIVADAFMFY